MRTFKKGAIGLPILLTGALFLSACGSTDNNDEATNTAEPEVAESVMEGEESESAEAVTLTYVGSAYTPEALQPVFDQFMTQYPNITIKYESIPFDDLNTVIQTRLPASDGGIDIYDADMPRISAYAARGWLADLTSEFGDLSGQIDAASLDSSTVDGQLLAMPLNTSSQLLYYNKDALTKAGIDFPSGDPSTPMTWQEVAAAGKLAQNSGAQWGLIFDQIDRYYQLEPLPVSLGGGPGGSGEGNLTPDVTGPEWVTAFEWYRSLYEDGIGPRGIPASATPQEFATGNTAFFAGGPWWAPLFVEGNVNFGVAPYPYMAGGDVVTPSGAWSLGVNPNTPNMDAAMTFLRFMGIDDGGITRYTDGMPIPPANLLGAQSYYEQEIFKNPAMAGSKEILEYQIPTTSIVRLKTVGYIEFEEIMGTAFADIINGSNVAETLQRASDQLTDAWAKYM